ncbi:MAG TPA: hypothetical protein VMI31_03520 [Fimbriimonadaceae bacterium]|nr:hypothetical protein [Fimbriimonadaceae bacterium]
MRTTIDLPEELLRRAKATAAMRGMRMKDLIANILNEGLGPAPGQPGRLDHGALPDLIPAAGRKIPFMRHADLMAMLDEEEGG